MRVIEITKKMIELTACEKETLNAAIEICCELYHNDEENRIWNKIESDYGSIFDFDDYAKVMECLLELSNEDELSI